MNKEQTQQVLDTLQQITVDSTGEIFVDARPAIAILQAALDAPECEPVAYFETITGQVRLPDDEHRVRFPKQYVPLYTHPSKQPEPLLSDLAMMVRRLVLAIRRNVDDPHKDLTFANDCLKWLDKNGLTGTPLRDTTQPKPPKPLTDNEIEDYGFTMLPNVAQGEFIDFARSIEAAVYARRAK
jgi:hypothetical protein